MKNLIKLLILLFMFLLFSNCKKKCNEYLLGNLLYTNPLQGYETLVFYDSDGDSIIFEGEGRKNWLNKTYHDRECQIVEHDDCYFGEESNKYELTISLVPTIDYQSAFLCLNLLDYTFNDYWHYNSRSLFDLPLKIESLKPGQSYFDSLLVLNMYFYNVFADEPELDTSPNKSTKDTIHPSMFYYTTSHGVVKIDFDDGSSWELKEIIP